jgi:hypothetical protein
MTSYDNTKIYTPEIIAEAKKIEEKEEKLKVYTETTYKRRKALKEQLLAAFKDKPEGFTISGSLFQLNLTDSIIDIDDHFTWITTNLQAESIGMYATPSKPMKISAQTTYYPEYLPDQIQIKKLSVVYDEKEAEKRLAPRNKRKRIAELTQQILKIDEQLTQAEKMKVMISNESHEDDKISRMLKVLKMQQDKMQEEVESLINEHDD